MLVHDTISDRTILFIDMQTIGFDPLATPLELITTKSAASFIADSDIFKYFMHDIELRDYNSEKPIAVGSTGFFIRDGFTAADSCFQLELVQDTSDTNYIYEEYSDGNNLVVIVDNWIT